MSSTAKEEKSLEFKIFTYLTVFLAPLLSVLLVSGLRFAICLPKLCHFNIFPQIDEERTHVVT
ncbi:hypothetical protein [Shewanella violacea]|uniref:hypothetical protein n=1 Tax=Shewanella violacea TaxID=60217 RepID=UPI000674E678|nr:hypothetical protein [Shewanella violacea]